MSRDYVRIYREEFDGIQDLLDTKSSTTVLNANKRFMWLYQGREITTFDFQHKPGHQICYHSSSSGKRRNNKHDWKEFLEVRRRLTSLFVQEKKVERKSPLPWETARMIIIVLT